MEPDRDVAQIVETALQIAVFATPIMWPVSALGDHRFVADINPIYHLIELVRAPLLGNVPSAGNYLAVFLLTLINVAIGGVFFVRFRSRLAYWI